MNRGDPIANIKLLEDPAKNLAVKDGKTFSSWTGSLGHSEDRGRELRPNIDLGNQEAALPLQGCIAPRRGREAAPALMSASGRDRAL
jgi:hypothetical protein